ncbi:hypothetical protein AeRB84_013810 [Aphanomyces euteiches]|nr:hypothetical protein AeRB84_013810 [Aphanomyces euteiches]
MYASGEYFKPTANTDHLWHKVELQPVKTTRVKCYWKLPKELLAIREVREAIVSEAGELLERLRNSNQPGDMWTQWQRCTKRFFQKYHARMVTNQKNALQEAKIQWLQAQLRHHHGRLTEAALNTARAQCETKKQDLKQHHADLSFDFHATQNEAPTSHFFRKPRARQFSIPIVECYDEQGNVTAIPEEIHAAFTRHWSSVMSEGDFQPRSPQETSNFLNVLERHLPQDNSEALDAPLTIDELAQSIKTMNPHKSPGIDGFSAGFYQLHPALFGEILSIVFNHQLQEGIMLASQRWSAISLLFKGGDRRNPANYRPIALIPVESYR